MKKNQIIIFTDGSSRGNPGVSGWGAILVFPQKNFVKEIGGREEHSTNNRMEMTAVLEALVFVSKKFGDDEDIVIYLDSGYVLKGITKWVKNWIANNWVNSQKQEVLNKDLWKKLFDAVEIKKEKIEWKLIPGHSGIIGNERCDEIATSFADKKKIELYEGEFLKYKFDVLNVTRGLSKNLVIKKEKINTKKRSKMSAYSYLSLVDGIIKKHNSWKECEERVKGVSNTKFKKSLSLDEEEKIISEWKEGLKK